MNLRAHQRSSLAYIGALTFIITIVVLSIFSSAFANGNIYYVDQSAFGDNDGSNWEDAYLTLQQALDVAVSGDEIWVAEGVYKPTRPYTPTIAANDFDPPSDFDTDKLATFLLTEGVAIYGGFESGGSIFSDRDWESNLTILSGDIDNNDSVSAEGYTSSYTEINGANAYHVIQGNITVSYTLATVVDGFFVTAGSASNTVQSGGFYDAGRTSTGGGINFRNDANVTLRNLHIIGNDSGNDGGGIHFFYESSPVLENITIENSRAGDFGGGIFFHSNNNPSFSNVKIIGTQGRYASGIYLHENNSANFGNFYACRNSSWSGRDNSGTALSFANNNAIKVSNAAFAANVSDHVQAGGAIRMRANNIVDIDNVTITGNQSLNGGGIYIREAGNTVNINNSIIWGNSSEIESDAVVNLNVSYSLISNSASPYTGTGNVASTSSPFIEDPTNGDDNTWGGSSSSPSDDTCGDLELDAGSVPIDAGSNADIPADFVDVNANNNFVETLPIDLDGNVRILNSTVDMGAYESSGGLNTQTITFDLPAEASNGLMVDDSVLLTASSDSGLEVTLAVDTTDICTLNGNEITMDAGGTCAVTASQSGGSGYEPAASVTRDIAVSKFDQSIVITSPMDNSSHQIDSVLALTGSSSSNLSVIFTSDTPTVCSVSSNNVTLFQAGICTILANQAGDGRYNAAEASVSLSVIKKEQEIDFISPDDGLQASVGETFTLFATSDSGLTVSFDVTTPTVCEISQSNTVIEMIGNGSCQIKASQAGDATYYAAVDEFKSIVVGSDNLLFQSIEFTAPENNSSVAKGDTIELAATATSNLPVTFISKTTDICTVSGNLVTTIETGICQITARQNGNGSYNAAPDVVKLIQVKNEQQISFNAPAAVETSGVGSTISLEADTDSNLQVTYESQTPAVCAVDGNQLAIINIGVCRVTASQTGNTEWLEAPDVEISFLVAGTNLVFIPVVRP
ncbi:MAG: right-handed parallel beta-helix repeat-containing protein [Chloroflexota bacterium]